MKTLFAWIAAVCYLLAWLTLIVAGVESWSRILAGGRGGVPIEPLIQSGYWFLASLTTARLAEWAGRADPARPGDRRSWR